MYASTLSTIRPANLTTFSSSEVSTEQAYLNPQDNYSHHIAANGAASLHTIQEQPEEMPYKNTSHSYIEHARRINLAREQNSMHHLLV